MVSVRRLTSVAVLSALSFLLMFFAFPIIPGADFLQLDLSILPMLVALQLFGIKEASLVLLLRSLLKFLLNNQGVSTAIGLPMNIIGLATFFLVLALFWKKKATYKQYWLASAVATVAMTAIMVLLNYVYAIPLYATFASFDIGKIIGIGTYLQAMVIPFNLLAGIIYAVSFFLLGALIHPVVKPYEK